MSFFRIFPHLCSLKIFQFVNIPFRDVIIGIMIRDRSPSSLILKLWSSCSLANLFLQSVLTLNIELNFRSSFALAKGVISNILMMFKMFLHSILILDENTFLQILKNLSLFTKMNFFQPVSGPTQTVCFLFHKKWN